MHNLQSTFLLLALLLGSVHCARESNEPAPETSPARPTPPATLALRRTLELRPLGNASAFALALTEGPLPPGVEARVESMPPDDRRTAVFTARDLATIQAWSRTLNPPGMRVAIEESAPPQLHFVHTDDGFVVSDATTRVIAAAHTGDLMVEVTLGTDDAERFSELSQRLLDQELAIVFEDRVLSAPRVRERIDGGVVVISLGGSNQGPDGAQALVSALTGIPPEDVPLPAD